MQEPDIGGDAISQFGGDRGFVIHCHSFTQGWSGNLLRDCHPALATLRPVLLWGVLL
jgi:hypothetical protein